jgi:hypothetical protein
VRCEQGSSGEGPRPELRRGNGSAELLLLVVPLVLLQLLLQLLL